MKIQINGRYLLMLIKTILFLLILAYIVVHLTYSFRSSLANTRDNISGYYGEDKDTLDMVVLGTSSTFSSYIPMEAWQEYGIASYDFCTNVLFENAMKYHVREIFKTQSPKLLVIDTAPFLYGHKTSEYANQESDGELRYNTDAFSISWNRFNMVNAIAPKNKNVWDYQFDLAYNHSNEEPERLYYNNRFHNESKGYHNLSFEVMFTQEQLVVPMKQSIQLPEEDDQYLKELLDELVKYDCEVLFITQPIAYTEENVFRSGYANYIGEQVQSYGYDYLDMEDYIDRIGIDTAFDYSLDYLHFHVLSAQKITHFLGAYVIEHYQIPDRRDDVAYQGWKEQYDEWMGILDSEKTFTQRQIIDRLSGIDSLQEYLQCMRSDYFECYMYAPKDSVIYKNPELSALIVEVTRESDDEIMNLMDTDADLCMITKEKSSGKIVDMISYEEIDDGTQLILKDHDTQNPYTEEGEE